MEHFRIAAGASLTEHDQMPYIAVKDYKDVPFADYPEWTGKQHLLAYASLSESPEDMDEEREQEVASFIQTWLFFCLLQQFLRPYFVHDDFVEYRTQPDGTSKPFVTTAKLLEVIARRNENPVDKPLDREDMRKIDDALADGRMTLLYRENLRPLVISISSVLMLVSCTVATSTGYGLSRKTLPVNPPFQVDLDLMTGQGWCLYEASRHWKASISVDSQMLLRTSQRHDTRDHGRCTRTFCTYREASLDSYVVSHVSADCGCDDFTVSFDESQGIIESGRLVLLEVDMAAPKVGDMFRAVSSSPDEPYIAISHVWADGLGNPAANSLPLCRLLDLSQKVHELVQSLPGKHDQRRSRFRIWIDTLCCPVKPADSKRLSLAAMADTYRLAERVLVLDADLQKLVSRQMHIVEAGVYIAHSDWMLRLWCFQEGGLARKLHFRFLDGNLDLDSFSERKLAPYRASPKFHGMAEDVVSRLAPFFHLYTDNIKPDSLETFHKAVQFRDVTVPSDEAICLNAMIGQRPTGTDGEGEENMSIFWTACADAKLLYAEHLFHTFPCMKTKGNRWAPKTLRIDPTSTITDPFANTSYFESISLTPDGAQANMEGLVMSSTCRSNSNPSAFGSSRSDESWLLARMPQAPAYYLFVFNKSFLANARERLLSAPNIGVMISTDGDMWSSIVGSSILGIIHERDEVIKLERLISGCCFLLPPSLNEKIDWIMSDTNAALQDMLENEQSWRDFFSDWPLYKAPDVERLLSMTFKPILDMRDGFDFEISEWLPSTQTWVVD